jgi:hypothetical protein
MEYRLLKLIMEKSALQIRYRGGEKLTQDEQKEMRVIGGTRT